MKPVRKIKIIFYLFAVAGFLLLTSCEEEKPDTENLAHAFVEVSLVYEEGIDSHDSLQTAKDSVLSKYGFTEKEFEEQIKNLKASSEIWDKFFKQANEYLDSLETAANNK